MKKVKRLVCALFAFIGLSLSVVASSALQINPGKEGVADATRLAGTVYTSPTLCVDLNQSSKQFTTPSFCVAGVAPPGIVVATGPFSSLALSGKYTVVYTYESDVTCGDQRVLPIPIAGWVAVAADQNENGSGGLRVQPIPIAVGFDVVPNSFSSV